jgi:hypothetical protein
VESAGHDLLSKKTAGDLPAQIVLAFQSFLDKTVASRMIAGGDG